VDELQHERSPCHDTSTTRQEISSDDVLERVKVMDYLTVAQLKALHTSSTLLLPLLWLPSTQICGRSIWDPDDPTVLNTS